MSKILRGGSFNLKFGRDKQRVVGEVSRLFDNHDLDFLCVQEFSDYRNTFHLANRFDVVAGPDGPCESGVIVRHGLRIDKRTDHVYGDGWTTTRGGHFPAAWQYEARLGGWLYVRSVHLPTPTFWPDGRLQAPAERADDMRETMVGLRLYLDRPAFINARLAAGDWNEEPGTTGTYTPQWLARVTRANLEYPQSREGHGRIDYAIARGARIEGIFKDTKLPELSDHEPVIFRVVKGR